MCITVVFLCVQLSAQIKLQSCLIGIYRVQGESQLITQISSVLKYKITQQYAKKLGRLCIDKNKILEFFFVIWGEFKQPTKPKVVILRISCRGHIYSLSMTLCKCTTKSACIYFNVCLFVCWSSYCLFDCFVCLFVDYMYEFVCCLFVFLCLLSCLLQVSAKLFVCFVQS